MTKWHYYVDKEGKGYWSMSTPWQVSDNYVSYVFASRQPTGGPEMGKHPMMGAK